MALDPGTAAMIAQLGKLAIQSYFTWMEQAGATEEEIEEMFKAEREEFKARRPEDLPLPPK